MKVFALNFLILCALIQICAPLAAQNPADSIEYNILEDFIIEKKKPGTSRLAGPEIGFKVDQSELFRAACCNLGESFTTNPSVDVNYNDAATGSRQIKLLGLSGNYVQLLTENLPNFRGAARPYALRYVPGPWMKSISVSKGSSTVKNGFESMSGQIDVEYLKPQDPAGVVLNAYIDSRLKLEANADANFHLSPTLNTEVLGHFEDRFLNHDGNHDGFTDMPDIRQFNFQNRWNMFLPHYIMHAGIGVINERSLAGQLSHHSGMHIENPYRISMNTQRYEAYMKHAFILDHDHNTNIAWMSNGSLHDLDALYGIKGYDVKEWNAFSQLMFETDFNDKNNFSAGLSYNFDYLRQHLSVSQESAHRALLERENTAGAYVQYTWKPSEKFTLMGGVRGDWSSLYKWFVTPRFNVRYSPVEGLTLRASAGKGHRTVFAWAEYNYLLASSRALVVENLNQESSWNYGFNVDYLLHIKAESIRFGAEYYYTKFDRQVVVDYESPHVITVGNLQGRSFAHTVQVEVSYESSFGLSATAAWRLNDVKTTYQGKLLEKPLTSRYKGLFTVSYSTPMDIWQFDLTLQLNGPGRMPAPYLLSEPDQWSWSARFPAYPMLNFQATRWFRHFSIYAGAENITNFRQKNPIIGSSDPWGPDFDSTLVWGPIDGIMFYAGIRFNFGKL